MVGVVVEHCLDFSSKRLLLRENCATKAFCLPLNAACWREATVIVLK